MGIAQSQPTQEMIIRQEQQYDTAQQQYTNIMTQLKILEDMIEKEQQMCKKGPPDFAKGIQGEEQKAIHSQSTGPRATMQEIVQEPKQQTGPKSSMQEIKKEIKQEVKQEPKQQLGSKIPIQEAKPVSIQPHSPIVSIQEVKPEFKHRPMKFSSEYNEVESQQIQVQVMPETKPVVDYVPVSSRTLSETTGISPRGYRQRVSLERFEHFDYFGNSGVNWFFLILIIVLIVFMLKRK